MLPMSKSNHFKYRRLLAVNLDPIDEPRTRYSDRSAEKKASVRSLRLPVTTLALSELLANCLVHATADFPQCNLLERSAESQRVYRVIIESKRYVTQHDTHRTQRS